VLQALCSALEFQSAVLWKTDGDELHRVSEWTVPAADGDARGRAGFAVPVVATTGTVGVIELLSPTPHERDERLERLLAIIGRQLGERVGHDRGPLLGEAEQAAGAGSFELDLDSGAIGYSPGLCTVVAMPAGMELTFKLLLSRMHREDRAMIEKSIARARQTDEPFSFELRVKRFDEVPRMMRVRGRVSYGDSGPAKAIGTIQDITDEAMVRAERDLLSYVVEGADDAIMTKSKVGTITTWNRGAEKLYGYTADEAIGRPISVIEPPDRNGEQAEILHRVFAGETVDEYETERVRKDGTTILVSLTVSPVRDANDKIVSVAVIARDITERKRDEERLRHLADHDQLTGLVNRRRFDQELKRELAKAGRYHSHSAVLSVDVDNFKAINDSAGHAAGDAVLIEVAEALRSRFRSSDVVARLGGDEFGVLVSSVGVDEARAAADDLLSTIRARPATYGGMPFRVTASIGVTAFESDDVTASEVLVNADLAMYAAKAGGRDRVVVYTPAEARKARAIAKLTWSQRIQDALERDRFVLHLQPILELESGEVSHGELLLRMRGDRGKLIAPGAFLPAAERFGLIHAIDRWVVQEAIRMIAGATPGQSPRLGVNLSGESVVGDPDLLSMIERELDNSAIDPSNLIFEITETAAIANMTEATRFAHGLTNLGCNLALDDFGTGFGSFYYLKHLPVRYVKLDGEFIQNLPRNKVDEHMVKAIVGVAHGLGIKTVAESVADDETIQMLQHHGVDFAQGFHIGRPAPVPVPLA
jgi:diguanylate cyclase (GGDEF)-like protein/PAS domain S-box-containing protein